MIEKKPLTKDRECGRCKHFFDCKGKPRKVKQCLNFEEVKKNG